LCVPFVSSPNCHPCIDASEHKSFGGFFHHPVEERTNAKKNPNSKNPPRLPLKPQNYCPKKRVLINKTKILERDIWKQTHENPRIGWK